MLALRIDRETLTLTVRDGGPGFPAETPPVLEDGGMGLAGLKDRVESLGGRIETTPPPAVGPNCAWCWTSEWPNDRTAIRVVLADDHPIYRDGLAHTLADAGIAAVGQASDGEEAIRLAAELRPDLVLLDISMPKGGGLGALRFIRALPDPPHVATLTAPEEQEDLVETTRQGALGYVLKGVGAGELVVLVRALAQGHPHVTPGIAGRLLVSLRGRSEPKPHHPMADLSRREEDILCLVAEGQVEPRSGRGA